MRIASCGGLRAESRTVFVRGVGASSQQHGLLGSDSERLGGWVLHKENHGERPHFDWDA